MKYETKSNKKVRKGGLRKGERIKKKMLEIHPHCRQKGHGGVIKLGGREGQGGYDPGHVGEPEKPEEKSILDANSSAFFTWGGTENGDYQCRSFLYRAQ